MKPPLFWFNPPERPGLLAALLGPLSLVWKIADARRWVKGRHQKMAVPVICVGNINMGGTGKTPTVIELVGRLADLGKTAHVVSRGYGGSLRGPVRIDPNIHSADEVGDEPLLLAAFAPCWVAKNRLEGALAAQQAGADVIVLDDGMQNPALAADLTVLVVDAQIGFGNGRVFPAGPLRQTVDNGLDRADLVLTIGPFRAQQCFAKQWQMSKGKTQATGELQPLLTGMEWEGLRSFAFAGIGRPKKFFDTLQGLGAKVVERRAFSDHQKLPLALLQRMEKEAAKLDAQLVTTEKDAARLPAAFQQKVLTLPVRLELDDPEPIVSALEKLFT